MENEINMYPRNIEEFKKKMNFLLETLEDKESVLYLKEWLSWFNELNYELSNDLEEGYFLKPYYALPDNFSLQVWKRDDKDNYNEVSYNLISNHYSIFNNDETLMVEK